MDHMEVAKTALDHLRRQLHTDAAAILYLPSNAFDPAQLEVVASNGESESYIRPTLSLAEIILRDGDAVLARNISEWRIRSRLPARRPSQKQATGTTDVSRSLW
jgi:hypothetical protein